MRYISQSDRELRRAQARRRLRRQQLVLASSLVAIVLAAVALASTGGSRPRSDPASAARRVRPASVKRAISPAQPIAPAKPGVARVIMHGPVRREIALTFDDGFCPPCVARIIHTLAVTGFHATIFPNGVYGKSWEPQAATIRRLVDKRQLQIGNHTFLHHDALLESATAFQTDLTRNEDWIEQTFGVSARPFFRPPYGAYNSRTLAIAGQLGYTKVITWSGTVADSSPRSVGYILGAIRHWARPGAIILMHGNYPPTSIALPQILEILKARGLRPVTLAELLA